MTRLEELEKLINEQTSIVKDAKTAAMVASESYETEIKKTITAFLSAVAPVRVWVSARGYSASGRVDLAETNKTLFDFYYDTEYGTNDYRLTVNIGTCGSFGIRDEAEVLKYRVFSAFLDNFEEIEKVFKNTGNLYELVKDYYSKETVLHTYTHEKQEIERAIENQKIIDTIQVGNYYKNIHYRWYNRSSNGYKDYKYVKLSSLTKKSANLDVGNICSNGWQACDTYRMNKEAFFDAVIHGSLVQVDPEVERFK